MAAARLSPDTLDQLSAEVERPGYAREAQACGIVHLGIGAFHRAHQAVYTDDAMAGGDRDWAITGVSFRSSTVHDQLTPQGGLYTVTERSGARNAVRLIGAVRSVVMAQADREAVIASLAAPETHIVSLTVTEKGYLTDGRDDATIYDYLVPALARRRAAGLAGLSLLSCDNLADNGAHLAQILGARLEQDDRDLARWFHAECSCPSTMIDRIVPATTPADRITLAQAIGLVDEGAVMTEPFSQWVIEDRFAGPRPRWEAGGAQLVADVRPYEAAKLRMLNGAHSALAYLGLARGHRYVHQAIADPELRPLIDRLMRDEAAASLPPSAGLDLNDYADRLIARFSNVALEHQLIQIAMDGSQKIPQRWLETLAESERRGRSCPVILRSLAAWIIFVRGDGHPVDDPMASKLALLWQTQGATRIVSALFGSDGLFAQHWVASSTDSTTLRMLLY